MSVPKAFEREIVQAFRLKYPIAFVEKNPDKQYQKSPPDVIVNAGHASYLIECKTKKGRRIPTNRLDPHQHDYLMKYQAIGPSHFGFIATMFYNGRRGNGRIKDAWLIPIDYWSEYQDRYSKKSLNYDRVKRELEGYRLHWKPGIGWELPDWI